MQRFFGVLLPSSTESKQNKGNASKNRETYSKSKVTASEDKDKLAETGTVGRGKGPAKETKQRTKKWVDNWAARWQGHQPSRC